MSQAYFLGANSANGFVGNYAGFCNKDTDYLYVIKGTPGCGKSTFMKKLAQAAESSGMQVDRVYCSGDPGSLDAVYFPALNIGYVDGTAPHITEPSVPGIRGEYLDFTRYIDFSRLRDAEAKTIAAHKAYKSAYRKAYDHLAVHRRYTAVSLFGSCRFYRAITCRGIVSLLLPDEAQPASAQEVAELASRKDCIQYRNPLWPELIEAVWLPQEKRCICFEPSMPDCQKAVELLSEAKRYHDELESCYHQAVDFSGIDLLLEKHLKKYFSETVVSPEKM